MRSKRRLTSSGLTAGPRSLISVCSPEVGSITARLIRVSAAILVKSVSTDSSCSCSSTRDPVGPPTKPVAITGRPSRLSARATLIPLPPATVRLSTARWRCPRRKFGTATVRSIAAFRVTVRITWRSPDFAPRFLPTDYPVPQDRRDHEYHEHPNHDRYPVVCEKTAGAVEAAGLGNRAAGAEGDAADPAALQVHARPAELPAPPQRALDRVRRVDPHLQLLAAANPHCQVPSGPQRQLAAGVADFRVRQVLPRPDRQPAPVLGEAPFEQRQVAVEAFFVGPGTDHGRDQADAMALTGADEDIESTEGVAGLDARH